MQKLNLIISIFNVSTIIGLIFFVTLDFSISPEIDLLDLLALLGVLVTVVAFLTATYFIVLAVDVYSHSKKIVDIYKSISEDQHKILDRIFAEEERLKVINYSLIKLFYRFRQYFMKFLNYLKV